MKYIIEEIESIEQLDNFDNEYVYDVGIGSSTPYFYANNMNFSLASDFFY